MSKSIVFIAAVILAGAVLFAHAAAVAGVGPAASSWNFYPASDAGCGQMASGPSGDVWFCDDHFKTIDSISPAGVVTVYPGMANHEPGGGLVAAPDGNIWYGARGGGIVRMTPGGSLTFFRFPRLHPNDFSRYDLVLVRAMTVGSDGNIWSIDYNIAGTCGCLTSISMTGHVTLYPSPDGPQDFFGIATGSDGNIWYTAGSSTIERVTPGGVFTRFITPTGLYKIALAKDGDLYASGSNFKPNSTLGVLARITPSGQISFVPDIPGFPNGLTALTEGPDGNVWGNGDCSNNGPAQCLVKYDVVAKTFSLLVMPDCFADDTFGTLITGPDRNIWLQPGPQVCRPNNMIVEYLTGLR
jgi:virginiamycin B lyase